VRLIDLSREIAHRMPVHSAHPTVAIGCWNDHDEIHRAGNTTVTSKSLHLSLGDHAGTHVDAPCHFDPDPKAPSIDDDGPEPVRFRSVERHVHVWRSSNCPARKDDLLRI
jgi:kynurenine formamidase